MSPHWTQRPEGGGRFALWLIMNIGLKFGRSTARLILYPITLYFYFRRGPERRASYAFLQRAFGRPANMWQVMRHIHRFAGTILDRVFLLAGRMKSFEINIHGVDEVRAKLQPDRGMLLLGAHVGSFEVLRVLADSHRDIRVCVLLDVQQTPALTDMLHALNPDVARNVIDATRGGTEVVLALSEALQQGAVAAMLADRARPREPTIAVDFMGAPAQFPTAPFVIASMIDVPLVLCFGLYRGGKRYDLYFETFIDNLQISRRERRAELQAVVQRFAHRLEYHVRIDPYNWFNFYDFWTSENVVADAPINLPAQDNSGDRLGHGADDNLGRQPAVGG